MNLEMKTHEDSAVYIYLFECSNSVGMLVVFFLLTGSQRQRCHTCHIKLVYFFYLFVFGEFPTGVSLLSQSIISIVMLLAAKFVCFHVCF